MQIAGYLGGGGGIFNRFRKELLQLFLQVDLEIRYKWDEREISLPYC